jgi:transposase-like protein
MLVTCVDCGAREADQAAYEQGWQLVPPVCPACLRWTALVVYGCEAM